MPNLNPFFQNYYYTQEQRLLEDLNDELIKIHGMDVYYLPRTHINIDGLFLQDPLSEFDDALRIEMYLKTFEGWQGEGDLMTKFGITMADQMTLCLSRRRWGEGIGSYLNMDRPLEGDLIYLPITHAIFEIKFIEHEAVFYATGALQSYELHCERFNYSDEHLNTGVDEIDEIEQTYSDATYNYRLITVEGLNLTTDSGNRILKSEYRLGNIDQTNQNEFLTNASSEFVSFDTRNPFGN